MEKGSGVGDGSNTIAQNDLPGLCGTKINSVGKCVVREKGEMREEGGAGRPARTTDRMRNR